LKLEIREIERKFSPPIRGSERGSLANLTSVLQTDPTALRAPPLRRGGFLSLPFFQNYAKIQPVHSLLPRRGFEQTTIALMLEKGQKEMG